MAEGSTGRDDARAAGAGDDDLLAELAAVQIELSRTPYRCLARLGQGAFGTVYEVEHTGLGTKRALKILRATHEQNELVRDRFMKEAQALARLSQLSENLMRVLDSGYTLSGAPFFVRSACTDTA